MATGMTAKDGYHQRKRTDPAVYRPETAAEKRARADRLTRTATTIEAEALRLYADAGHTGGTMTTAQADIIQRLEDALPEYWGSIEIEAPLIEQVFELRGAIVALRRVGCTGWCSCEDCRAQNEDYRAGCGALVNAYKHQCHRCRILAEEIAKAEKLLEAP